MVFPTVKATGWNFERIDFDVLLFLRENIEDLTKGIQFWRLHFKIFSTSGDISFQIGVLFVLFFKSFFYNRDIENHMAEFRHPELSGAIAHPQIRHMCVCVCVSGYVGKRFYIYPLTHTSFHHSLLLPEWSLYRCDKIRAVREVNHSECLAGLHLKLSYEGDSTLTGLLTSFKTFKSVKFFNSSALHNARSIRFMEFSASRFQLIPYKS